ncbi:MAG: hypothetical protein AAGL24_10025 [Pseudomonadota bacterium]
MVDFDASVNAAAVRVFGQAKDNLATYHPLASVPGGPDFAVDGIFDRDSQVVEAEGVAHSSAEIVFSVRLSAFAVPPAQNDEITIPGEGRFRIFDTLPDSGGMTDLVLKTLS